MFLSSDTLSYLLSLGLDGEKVVELVRHLERDAQSVAPVLDPMREKKRERDRERYRSRNRGETGSKSYAEIGGEIAAKSATNGHAEDARIRGEDNLSRLDTTGGFGVGGGAREADHQPDDWPKGDHAKLLVRAVDSPWLDPAKSPELVTTAGRIAAWKRDGASWEHDVLPVVTGLCAHRKSRVASWKFFDAAMGRSIADNRAALEIPQAVPRQPGQGPPRNLTDQIADERKRATEITLAKLNAANG